MSVFDLANYQLTWYAIPPFIVGWLTFLLGTGVLLRERGTMVSVAFWLMATMGAVWLESYVGIFSARADAVALWWCRAENVAVAFIPTAVYLFTLAVVQRIRQFRPVLWGSVALSTVFVWTILQTSWFVAGVYHYPWGAYAKYGPLSLVFLLLFTALIGASVYLYGAEVSRCHSPAQRQRVQEFFWAFCIASVGSVDYLAAYGVPVYPFGYLPVFIFLVLTARAIWRYRLVDITPAFAAQQIISTMVDAVLVVDAEGIIRVTNEAASRMFERSADELIGHPIGVVEERFFGAKHLSVVMRAGLMERYERLYQTRSRGEWVLDLSVSALPDQAGRPVGVVCIARDVTERRRAEQAIREAKAYAEGIADTVREPVVVLDVNLRVQSANQSFYQTFGVAPEEAKARYIYELGQGRWHVSKLRGLLKMLPRTTSFQGIEIDYEFPDRGCRTLLLNARRIHRAETQTEMILLAMEDVTERKRLEDQLKVAIAELEAAQPAARSTPTPPRPLAA